MGHDIFQLLRDRNDTRSTCLLFLGISDKLQDRTSRI